LKTVRILKVIFDCKVIPAELPAFRAAVIEKAGREHRLFHNHLGKEEYVYGYPLIQYKSVGRKPMIFCIEQGVEEVHHLFKNKSWELMIGDRPIEMKVENLKLESIKLNIWDKMIPYQIRNWVALNQENYKEFLIITSLVEKIKFLEAKFIGNIISLAKGVEWQVEREIKCTITHYNKPVPVMVKGQKIMGFNLELETNIYLPNHIGIGKNVSLGYGMIFRKEIEIKEK